MNITRNILLNPGPATTSDTVKEAQIVPDICPREKEFGSVMEFVAHSLVKIANGNELEHTAVLFGGSGTASMDAVINSVVPPKQKILVINNGAYGKRLADIARAYNIDCLELKYPSDSLPNLDEVELLFRVDPTIACLAMIHHETTTGILNPIKKFGELTKKYHKTFIVDTISSFAGVPIDIQDFNIDFMMSTSNKCIQGMAGVSFVICKKTELEKIKNYPRRSYYLSLYDQYHYFEKNYQMRFTPPVQTIYALKQAINEFFIEGAQNRINRYTENWKILRQGVQQLGFQILTQPEDESHILITLLYLNDARFDFDKIHDILYTKGFTIYPGKLDDQRNSFRLANMGEIYPSDIKQFLVALEETLTELGITPNKQACH